MNHTFWWGPVTAGAVPYSLCKDRTNIPDDKVNFVNAYHAEQVVNFREHVIVCVSECVHLSYCFLLLIISLQ